MKCLEKGKGGKVHVAQEQHAAARTGVACVAVGDAGVIAVLRMIE